MADYPPTPPASPPDPPGSPTPASETSRVGATPSTAAGAAPQSPPPAYGAYPPYGPPPMGSRRLTRSSRERMWAGVAGGMAEYFDLDPSLVRLLWALATVVTGGLAVAVYILAWIVLPRDDRSPGPVGPGAWRDWSHEFHSETTRLAEEA